MKALWNTIKKPIYQHLSKILSNLTRVRDVRHLGPLPDANDTIHCLEFINLGVKRLVENYKRLKRKYRNKSKSKYNSNLIDLTCNYRLWICRKNIEV